MTQTVTYLIVMSRYLICLWSKIETFDFDLRGSDVRGATFDGNGQLRSINYCSNIFNFSSPPPQSSCFLFHKK